MSEAPIVCDASPLIALAQIDRLDLLREIYGTVVIPPAVAREIVPTLPRPPAWMVQRPLLRPVLPTIAQAELGPGETEALTLALDLSIDRVLLDERQGRRLARRLRITAIGTLGLLLLAKRRGLLAAVRPEIEALGAVRFHLASDLIALTLVAAGEDPPSDSPRG